MRPVEWKSLEETVVELANPGMGVDYLEHVHGHSVFLPLPSGAKAPPPKGWQRMTEHDLASHCRNHGGNFGVVPDGLFIIDVDIKKDVDGFSVFERHDVCPPRTLAVATPSGGLHLYYRRPAGADKLRLQAWASRGIDVRSGRSGYVVAPGGRLSDGGRYRVVLNAPIAELPPEMIALWEVPRPQVEKHRAARVTTVEDARRVGELLRRIDPNSPQLTAREDWLAILMAIATLLGPAGEELAAVWSARWYGQHARPPEEVYRSLQPDGSIGLGTLVHWARWATPTRTFDPDADREQFDRALDEACAGLQSLAEILPAIATEARSTGLRYERWWDRSAPGWADKFREPLAAVGLDVAEGPGQWELRQELIELVAASTFRHWARPSRYGLWAMTSTWNRPLTDDELGTTIGLWPHTMTDKGNYRAISWDRAFQSAATPLECPAGECTLIGEQFPRRIELAGRVFANRFSASELPGWQALRRRMADPRPVDDEIVALWHQQLARVCGEDAEAVENSLAHGVQSLWRGHDAVPRLGYAIVFHSTVQGLGKSDIVNLIGTLLKGPSALVRDHNAYTGLNRFTMAALAGAGLVKIEEVKTEKDNFVQTIKSILLDADDTGMASGGLPWRTVERKGVDAFPVPYVAPLVLGTTNHLEDLMMTSAERRLMIVTAPDPAPGWMADAQEFHRKIMEDFDARIEVLTHLLRKPVEGVDPSRAPRTLGTQLAIEAGEPSWRPILSEILDQYDLETTPILADTLVRELAVRNGSAVGLLRMPRGSSEYLRERHGLLVGRLGLRDSSGGRIPPTVRVFARPSCMARFGLYHSAPRASAPGGNFDWLGGMVGITAALQLLGVRVPAKAEAKMKAEILRTPFD